MLLTAAAASTCDGWCVLNAMGPLIALLAAIIAGIIGWQTLAEQSAADRKSHWWSQVQWALDAALSNDPNRQTAGIRTLAVLSRAKNLDPDELRVLDAAWEQQLSEIGPANTRDGVAQPRTFSPAERRVTLEAARLCVQLNSQLGRVTPSWISDLAAGAP